MYAVIETGGKQYRVSPGQTVEVELLPAEPGTSVELDRVLLVSNEGATLVGKPVVGGAKVTGVVAREGRGKKVLVFKYKSKKRYRHALGHRQDFSYLMITDIQTDGKSLVSPEDRERYERLAARAADRYHAKVEAMLGALEEDEEDEATLSEDEEPGTTE
jgi:large subunit ribosomal protein L21